MEPWRDAGKIAQDYEWTTARGEYKQKRRERSDRKYTQRKGSKEEK